MVHRRFTSPYDFLSRTLVLTIILSSYYLYSVTTIHALSNTSPTSRIFYPPNTVSPPPISPATQLPNQIYTWRNHQIRYQMAGDPTSTHAVVLIHGLFVNSDHWRKTLKALAKAGYRAYAIDLLGYGYSSKPHPADTTSRQMVCGEIGRFIDDDEKDGGAQENIDPTEEEKYYRNTESRPSKTTKRRKLPSILKQVPLGTANGESRIASQLELKHPLSSPYNFFTWSEQVIDFTRDVVLSSSSLSSSRVTLVANSIGTISALQSVLDCPLIFNGVFSVSPNFRELHSAEVPLSSLSMPIVRSIQSLLRSQGQGLFDLLAKPPIVKQILKEPYAIDEAVDDELVDALLTPLLLPGASDVVFDTLSYSAGPLPEQQLNDEHFPKESIPVWICYGDQDPWTPAARVEQLIHVPSVEKVICLRGLGHCPHDEAIDEASDQVSPLLIEFLQRINIRN